MTSGYLELPKITITDELRDLARAYQAAKRDYDEHKRPDGPNDLDAMVLWDLEEAMLHTRMFRAETIYKQAIAGAAKSAAAEMRAPHIAELRTKGWKL